MAWKLEYDEAPEVGTVIEYAWRHWRLAEAVPYQRRDGRMSSVLTWHEVHGDGVATCGLRTNSLAYKVKPTGPLSVPAERIVAEMEARRAKHGRAVREGLKAAKAARRGKAGRRSA